LKEQRLQRTRVKLFEALMQSRVWLTSRMEGCQRDKMISLIDRYISHSRIVITREPLPVQWGLNSCAFLQCDIYSVCAEGKLSSSSTIFTTKLKKHMLQTCLIKSSPRAVSVSRLVTR